MNLVGQSRHGKPTELGLRTRWPRYQTPMSRNHAPKEVCQARDARWGADAFLVLRSRHCRGVGWDLFWAILLGDRWLTALGIR